MSSKHLNHSNQPMYNHREQGQGVRQQRPSGPRPIPNGNQTRHGTPGPTMTPPQGANMYSQMMAPQVWPQMMHHANPMSYTPQAPYGMPAGYYPYYQSQGTPMQVAPGSSPGTQVQYYQQQQAAPQPQVINQTQPPGRPPSNPQPNMVSAGTAPQMSTPAVMQMPGAPQQYIQPNRTVHASTLAQQQTSQSQPALLKRQRKPIAIVNPDDQTVVNEDAIKTASEDGPTSTPPSSDRSTPNPSPAVSATQVTSEVTPPQTVAATPTPVAAEQPAEASSSNESDIASAFKAKVLQSLHPETVPTTEDSPFNGVEPESSIPEADQPDSSIDAPTSEEQTLTSQVVLDSEPTKSQEIEALASPRTLETDPEEPVIEPQESTSEEKVEPAVAVAIEAEKPNIIQLQEEKTPDVESETEPIQEPVAAAVIPETAPLVPDSLEKPASSTTEVVKEGTTISTAVEFTKTEEASPAKDKSDKQLMPPPPQPKSEENKENKPLYTHSKSMSAAVPPAKISTDTYKYKEELTSPINSEAKRSYDREFLLKLQFANTSKDKPQGLPGLEDILLPAPITQDDPHRRRILSSNSRDFTPSFLTPLPSPRSAQKKRDSQTGPMGGQRRGGPGGGPAPIKIDYKREEVKLNSTANAWKAGDKKENLTEDEKVHAELLKTFRGFLNKITPQKFKEILAKVLALPVESEKDLAGIMNMVFEKALDEPAFSVTYANLCQRVAKEFKVPTERNPDEVVHFRKLLLVRCQREFEKSDGDEEELIAMTAELDKAEDEKERKKLQEHLELFTTKARRRKLGNIRFIGELFKLQMLLPVIMHDCVMRLLKVTDEESLECLCRLLTTIGKELDTEKAKTRTDQYFKRMSDIVEAKRVSARIRFAITDVIELRRNNWVPRRDTDNPKTIKEIHAQAALEAHEKAMMAERVQIPHRNSQVRGRNPEKRREDDGGWNTVGQNAQMKAQKVEPEKLKLTKQTMSSDIQLGPGGRGAVSSWGKGSSGSGKNTPPQQQEEQRSSTPTNRFQALSGGGNDSDGRSRSGQRAGWNNSGRAAGRGQGSRGNRSVNSTPRGSMEKDSSRAAALAAARGFNSKASSRGPSRDSSTDGRPPPSIASTAPSNIAAPIASKQAHQLDRSGWEQKSKAILDELLHTKDVKEAIECVKELLPQREMHLLTECSVNHVLERSAIARKQTGELLAELIKVKVLSMEDYMKGLHEVLQFAEDLAVDIPMVYKYLAELIAPIFCGNNEKSLTPLPEVCKPLKEFLKAGVLAAAILEEASHEVGHVDLGKYWNACNLQWSDFLTEDQSVETFIKDNKLEYTMASAGDHKEASRQASLEQIDNSLECLLAEKSTNESILDWISSNVSSEKQKEPSFIKSLVSVVTMSCVSGEKFSEATSKSRNTILKRYIDNSPDLEIAALFSLEEMVTNLQHPANMLSEIFYTYADEDLISDESFNIWKSRSQCGVAVASVNQFFQWLDDPDDK